MYQSIIRDPGGNGLIRIQPAVCGQYSAIVNGSILIVPPGTIAFVAINGTLSRPYGPGRYEIFTGVDYSVQPPAEAVPHLPEWKQCC